MPRPHLQNTPPEHDRRAGFDSAYCGLQLEPLQSVHVCTDNSIHVQCGQCCVSFAAKRISLLCRFFLLLVLICCYCDVCVLIAFVVVVVVCLVVVASVFLFVCFCCCCC